MGGYSRQTVSENELEDDAVTSAKIKDGEIVNADVNASAAIAYSKLASDPRICRIKVGTYTGDGATSQAITGVGFTPDALITYNKPAAHDDNAEVHIKTNLDTDNYSVRIEDRARETSDEVVTLDADGFTVDDHAVDSHPNKNGQVYNYIALG